MNPTSAFLAAWSGERTSVRARAEAAAGWQRVTLRFRGTRIIMGKVARTAGTSIKAIRWSRP